MTLAHKLVLGGVALAALGFAGAVVADNIHTLRVALPGGETETITYVGETPPKISFTGAAEVPASLAQMADPFAGDPVFAQMDRVAADMDARAAAMMRAANSLPAGGLSQTSLGALPPGVSGYSVVSTWSNGRSCVRTTQYAPGDKGGPEKILTSASQGCDTAAPANRSPAPVATAPVPRHEAASVTPVRWEGPQPATQNRD